MLSLQAGYTRKTKHEEESITNDELSEDDVELRGLTGLACRLTAETWQTEG
jgi:magnesium-transporting ATPase (P-type)